MKTADYCRAVKRKLGIESDYALAKALGLSKQAVSRYVNGLSTFDNTAAAQVSLILGIDFLKIVADLELERGSKSPELWKKLRDAAVVATMALGAASFGVLPGDCYASSSRFNNTFFAVTSTPLAPAPTTSHNATEVHIVRRLRRAAAAVLAFLVGLVGLVL